MSIIPGTRRSRIRIHLRRRALGAAAMLVCGPEASGRQDHHSCSISPASSCAGTSVWTLQSVEGTKLEHGARAPGRYRCRRCATQARAANDRQTSSFRAAPPSWWKWRTRVSSSPLVSGYIVRTSQRPVRRACRLPRSPDRHGSTLAMKHQDSHQVRDATRAAGRRAHRGQASLLTPDGTATGPMAAAVR
jgi:hypothetical protein